MGHGSMVPSADGANPAERIYKLERDPSRG